MSHVQACHLAVTGLAFCLCLGLADSPFAARARRGCASPSPQSSVQNLPIFRADTTLRRSAGVLMNPSQEHRCEVRDGDDTSTTQARISHAPFAGDANVTRPVTCGAVSISRGHRLGCCDG